MGPAFVYTALFGTTEPSWSNITSPPAAPWTDVGGIADGTSVLLEVEQSLTDIGNKQAIGGISREFSPGFALRLDLAHEWSPGNPARHTLHVGIVTRF